MPTKAELAARLSRKGKAGRKSLNGKPRTTAEASRLNYQTRKIVDSILSVDGFHHSEDTHELTFWLLPLLNQMPQEIRALRTDSDWQKLVRKRIEKRLQKEG